ncbi:MAG TPA: phosphatase PAP2 family protein [Myxococcales bacterium]|jgi:hypothetical protein
MRLPALRHPFLFRVLALALAASHLAFAWRATGLRWEHVAADLLLALLPWLGRRAHAFAWAALPVWLTGVLYDNQWLWHGLVGRIHLATAARSLGVLGPGGLDLPAWFHRNTAPALDLLAGFAYSTHLLELFGVAVFLFFTRPARLRGLAWAFLFANALGVVVSTLYPAAPPWYVIAHGSGPVDAAAASSAGGALRVDALLGIHYFRDFYSRNPFVWGAIASLHSAYPVLAAWAVWDRGWRWRVPTAAYACLMWFSALYLAHHYLLDVVIGVGIALAASALAHRVVVPALGNTRPQPAAPEDGAEAESEIALG